MSIPPEHARRHIYHFTHLENLPGILEHGFLSYNEQVRRGLKHRSIAATSIQGRRATMQVPCGPGGVVHDYVPLYFGSVSPMLLQIVRAKNVDQELLLHFAFPIALLDRPSVVFTSSSANRNTAPEFYEDPDQLRQLDWSAIGSLRWGKEDEHMKQARMAEALVHEQLDPREAAYILVWNEKVRDLVQQGYAEASVPCPRIDFSHHGHRPWFTHFRAGLPKDMLKTTIAHGPILMRLDYKNTVTGMLAPHERASAPRFPAVEDLLRELRSVGLSALPETRELLGLESDNEVHKFDVGTHTLNVVKALRASPEYRALGAADQPIVEVAAYLHDIGKGPKSRWVGCGGRQQVDADHPIRSMRMLRRIFDEEVGMVEDRAVRLLCKLVCYHDLVGDILGRGRHREQLAAIAETKAEVDMLIALGKADMSSIANGWATVADHGIDELRSWAYGQLEARGG